MSDELLSIRARHTEDEAEGPFAGRRSEQARQDRAWLLAEIERLRGGYIDLQTSDPNTVLRMPVAWAALRNDGDIAWIGYTPEGAADGACGRRIVPLYRQPQPMLTDAEREAVECAISREMDAEYYGGDEPPRVVTLRGLLERLK